MEKQALSLAESERRAKELRELQEASIDSDLNSNLNGILQSKPAEELSVSDLRTSSAELDNSVKNCEEDGGSSLTPLSAILTPIPLDAASVIAKNENSRSQPAFSLSEFEDDNVTPFELVELQTMNDIDELKSVLQPNAGSVPNGPSHPKHIMNRAKAQEIDYSFFTPLKTEPKTAIVEAGTANIALLIDTTASVSAASSASRPPLQALESTISVSLPSSLQVLASTDSISPSPFLQSSVSTSLTSQPDFSFNYNARGITPAPHSQPYSMNRNNINHLVDMDYVDMRSANSTNLTSTNSKSLPNLAQEGLITSNGELESFPHPDQNQDFAQPDSFVPTARISNIMQQYQFTRFTENEMNSSQRNNPDLGPVETVQDIPGLGPRPISRHGALPPMGHTPVPLTPSGRKTPPSNLSKTPPGASSFLTDGGGVPILPPWTSRSTHVLQSRMTPEVILIS